MDDMGPRTFQRGDRVAWTTLDRDGNPKSWTCAHRVFEHDMTFCSRAVPDRATTTIRPKQVTSICTRCERMYQRSCAYLKEKPREDAA
jgi:hypothetical protein